MPITGTTLGLVSTFQNDIKDEQPFYMGIAISDLYVRVPEMELSDWKNVQLWYKCFEQIL